jgi:hypothetical protein
MPPVLSFSKTSLFALAGIMDLSFVAGQVVLAPSTITQAVTLLVGTPASEFTLSVVRTGLVTLDTPPSVNSSPTLPPSIIPTVFVSDSASGATTWSGLNQPFSLPNQQAVVTQAPCVSACLQEGLIASAAGSCALTAGTAAIDNACACLSAPLVAVYALANCASAACTGVAAGPAGLSLDLVAVTSLYNDYCVTAVGAEALASAVASGQVIQATAAAGSSTTDTASASASTDTATPWSTGPSTNGTLTGNGTLRTNGTFSGGGPTLTVGPTAADPGIITTGLVSTTRASAGGTTSSTGSETKSEGCLELPRKSGG